ncbi:hypothetical protein AMTRI_Chr09g14460 [Amborella trichopoda]
MDHQSRGGSWNLVPSASQTLIQDEQQRFHSLPSQLHLLPIIENLADAIEGGTRDQHSDALLLPVEDIYCVLESLHLFLVIHNWAALELIAEYRRSVEEFTKSDCNR